MAKLAAPFDRLNEADGPVDPDLVGDLLFFEAQVKRLGMWTCSFERLGWAMDWVRLENSIEDLSLVSSDKSPSQYFSQPSFQLGRQ